MKYTMIATNAGSIIAQSEIQYKLETCQESDINDEMITGKE